MPFGVYTEKDVQKPRKKFLPSRAAYHQSGIEQICPEDNKVILAGGEDYELLFTHAAAVLDTRGVRRDIQCPERVFRL